MMVDTELKGPDKEKDHRKEALKVPVEVIARSVGFSGRRPLASRPDGAYRQVRKGPNKPGAGSVDGISGSFGGSLSVSDLLSDAGGGRSGSCDCVFICIEMHFTSLSAKAR